VEPATPVIGMTDKPFALKADGSRTTTVGIVKPVATQAPCMPSSPFDSPMSAEAFAEHLPLAVEGGDPLALVVLRGIAGARGTARLKAALRDVDGFAYELQPGGYAVLLPGQTAWQAFNATLTLRGALRGSVLRPGALVDAGVAALEPGMDARALFAAAAGALSAAEADGGGVRIGARDRDRRRAPQHA
jgi:hypothetical protein